jgi:hypothetical protein
LPGSAASARSKKLRAYQASIAGALDDAPVMRVDRRIDQVAP